MRSRLDFTRHNRCAVADPSDEHPFCYTTDPLKRWEHCNCKPIAPIAPIAPTPIAPTPKSVRINRTVKHETSGYSQEGQYRSKAFINQSKSKVLNCEQTAVCDITINNPLREAFRVVIHPMAEVRLIESIRNGTHVNIDSIQPSSIWLFPESKRNRVSFLCLPGGIENGLNHLILYTVKRNNL